MMRLGTSLGPLNKKIKRIETLGYCGNKISTDSALRAFVGEQEYKTIKKARDYFESSGGDFSHLEEKISKKKNLNIQKESELEL